MKFLLISYKGMYVWINGMICVEIQALLDIQHIYHLYNCITRTICSCRGGSWPRPSHGRLFIYTKFVSCVWFDPLIFTFRSQKVTGCANIDGIFCSWLMIRVWSKVLTHTEKNKQTMENYCFDSYIHTLVNKQENFFFKLIRGVCVFIMIKMSGKVDKPTLTTDSTMIFPSLLKKELLQNEKVFF